MGGEQRGYKTLILLQSRQLGWGLEVGLEMQELPPEPQQPHLGMISFPWGSPGCLAAPAEVSSSCATGEGCAAGSAA